MMLQVAWRTWGHGKDRASYVQHTRAPGPAHVRAGSTPGTGKTQISLLGHFSPSLQRGCNCCQLSQDSLATEPTVQRSRCCWLSAMGLPGVWGHSSLTAPECGGNRPALFLLQELLPWLAPPDPTAPHSQLALCWSVGRCSVGVLWVLLTQCISSGGVSVALLGRALPSCLWPWGTKSQPCHCQLQLWLLTANSP